MDHYSNDRFARRGIMNHSNEPSQFKLHSEYQPTGDQPQAIAELVEGFRQGNQFETLLGVTGSGKTFTIRANALAIPRDYASMFYAAVLTDAKGAIKEIISPVFTNSGTNYGDLPCNFNCQVKEASVREGNLVRIATSYNKKEWHLVKGINENVKDSIKAVGNEVLYHKITMPSSVQGATIQGAIDQIVHGMDFTCKIMPVSVADAITVSINGKIVADRQGVAQIKVESVREDLDIAIQVVAAGDETYTAMNLHAGELASKTSEVFPSRLKLMGEMNASDFATLQKNADKVCPLQTHCLQMLLQHQIRWEKRLCQQSFCLRIWRV